MRTVISRIGAMFRRRKLNGELDEELRAHLEMAAAEHRRRGMSEEEARRAALRDFGGVTQVRESMREREGPLWFENLRRDAGYALRQMRKSPGFALVVVLTLALGIGATTAMFTLVYSTLVRALPYPEAERIVALHDARTQGQSTGGLMSAPRFFDVRARNRSFESLGFFFFDQSTMIAGNRLPMSVQAAGTNAGFWDVLGVKPLLGRTYDARDDQPNAPETAVLSYSGWQKIFGGDPGVIQRPIRLDGREVTLVGVMPAGVDMPSGIDMWHDAQFQAADWTKYRGEGTRFINVFGRLRPGVTMAMAQADLGRMGEQLRREHPDTDGVWSFSRETLRENRYGEMRPALLVLMGASALLLLIACTNVANLLLSRATARQREVALRRALGASAGKMAMQFLTESAGLGLTGGGVGIVAAFALVRGVAAKLPGRLGVPGAVEMNWPVVLVALLVALGTGMAFGIAPVLENRQVELHTTMKRGEARLGGSRHGLRNALVSVQTGLSLILVIGASLLAESLWHLVKNPLGYQPDHRLTFSIVLPWDTKEPAVRNFFAHVQQRLEGLPGVTAVGQIDAPPTVDWHLRSNFDADWLPRIANRPAINAEDRNIGGNFLAAMGVPLLAGRMFTEQDGRMEHVPILVNQELVREYLPGGNPLGHHLIVDKERDAESGNDYFGARYYASAMGRFMSPDWSAKEDPVPYATMDDPQSLNLYSYVRNNPLSKTDPDGHCPFCIPILAGGASALGGAEEGAAIGAFGGPVGAGIGAVIGLGIGIYVAHEISEHSESEAAPAAPAAAPAAAPLPANPDDLKGQGYTETSHPDAAAAGHRTFENPTTGDKVRHDKGKEGANGHEGEDHYHRHNPNSTGKGDQYLDANGKPVPRGSDASHLQPQPPSPPPQPQPQPQPQPK